MRRAGPARLPAMLMIGGGLLLLIWTLLHTWEPEQSDFDQLLYHIGPSVRWAEPVALVIFALSLLILVSKVPHFSSLSRLSLFAAIIGTVSIAVTEAAIILVSQNWQPGLKLVFYHSQTVDVLRVVGVIGVVLMCGSIAVFGVSIAQGAPLRSLLLIVLGCVALYNGVVVWQLGEFPSGVFKVDVFTVNDGVLVLAGMLWSCLWITFGVLLEQGMNLSLARPSDIARGRRTR